MGSGGAAGQLGGMEGGARAVSCFLPAYVEAF